MASRAVLNAALSAVAAMFLIASGSASAEPAAATPAGRKLLPQQHAYQQTLRTFLGTLAEADFLPEHKVLTVVPTEMSPDDLFRTWLCALQPASVGRKRNHSSVMIKPGLFTLAAIEGPDAIMRPPAFPEPLVDLANWDYPGNTYFNSRALRLRAFALVALDMVMLDALLTTEVEAERVTQDQLGPAITSFAYVYPGFRDVVPADVAEAYRTGLTRFVRHALAHVPDKLAIRHPGIYTRMLPGLGLAAKVLENPAISAEAEAYARQIFTSERFFRKAGYFPHGGTLDSFNGMSTYYGLWTALANDWPFAREAMASACRLKAHLTLPEPDGTLVGPSHMAALTSADPITDQWGSRMRSWSAVLLSDDAAGLIKLPDAAEIQNGATLAVGEVNAQLQELSWTPGGLDPAPWKFQPAGMNVNFAYQYYPKGYYERRLALEARGDPVRLPVLRAENFLRNFGDEFLVQKTPTHAVILHTGPIADPAAAKIAYGFGGGALSAFWTPATGSVLLGRGVGSWNPRYKTLQDEWRLLPSHAVIGLTAEGKFITSAHIIKPDVTLETKDQDYTVTARGLVPPARYAEQLLLGTIDYARKFESLPHGMRITTTLTGDGRDSLAELYEVLPVFLREAGSQAKATPTSIEFQVDGKWLPATETYTAQATHARLNRFGGTVQVTFDRPRRVKLAPADWTDTYQTRAACRNILIDLLENNDQPATLQTPRQVSYQIEAPTAQ